MAQVEFMVVIWTILRAWRVGIMEHDGETPDEARVRFATTVADSSPKLTLQLSNPQNAVLKWAKR
jgi:hypothetical protein